MAQIESVQIKLVLTKNPRILKQLKANKLIRDDKNGWYVPVMFDGQEFRFRPNQPITVGKSIANSLYRNSQIMVGKEWLDGEFSAFLERVGEYSLTEGMSQSAEALGTASSTVCIFCNKDQKTQPRLARHLMDAHKDDPRMMEDDEDEKSESEASELDGADEVLAGDQGDGLSEGE